MNNEIGTTRREPNGGVGSSWLDLLSVAARPRRMAVLTALRRTGGLSIPALATSVAAAVDGCRPTEVNDQQHQEARVGLYHDQLPALRSRALIKGYSDDEPATIRTGPAFVPAHVERVATAVESGGLDPSTAAALADRSRRDVAAVLAEEDRPVELDRLVDSLRAAGTRKRGTDADSLQVRLHHADLPALAEADVVEYRSDVRVASYRGLPPAVESAVTGI